jgi:threonine dehydratase
MERRACMKRVIALITVLAAVIAVAAVGSAQNAKATTQDTGSFIVHVSYSNGSPGPGAEIRMLNDDQTLFAVATADSNGNHTFGGAIAGRYYRFTASKCLNHTFYYSPQYRAQAIANYGVGVGIVMYYSVSGGC